MEGVVNGPFDKSSPLNMKQMLNIHHEQKHGVSLTQLVSLISGWC